MPTFDKLRRFERDYRNLTTQERNAFLVAVTQFVEDLRERRSFRPGLRVKRVQGTSDVWEMSWASNGRATFQYGEEVIEGEAHIIWRRVGTHEIFRRP